MRPLKHPVALKIAGLMQEKKTNLTLSADVDCMSDLLWLADNLGPHIIVLKTHVDCFADFSLAQITALQKLAQKHHFLIFEDRKFADIGHTAARQFAGGIYRIADWAHLINAHGLPGGSQIEALAAHMSPSEQALLLLANMSNADTLFHEAYSRGVVTLGEQHAAHVCGFISPNFRVPDQFLNFSPGIHLHVTHDSQGQQYQSPESCTHFGVDSIIVGRGILQATDPIAAAKEYQAIGWKTFTTPSIAS